MKITLVTPSYNQAQFLEKTIQSVLAQNYDNLEWIVMDGGSNDGSAEILQENEHLFAHWQSEKDGGQSAAINAGMAKATGEICCWLNSDDRFSEGTLDFVAQYFEEHPECQWLVGHSDYIKDNGKLLNRVNAPQSLKYEDLLYRSKGVIAQPSMFWRRSLWQQVGGLRDDLHYCMDFDLWLKFAHISPGHRLDRLFSQAVIHDDMKTITGTGMMFAEAAQVLFELGEITAAKETIARVAQRACEIDQMFSFITKNKYYRRWRDK